MICSSDNASNDPATESTAGGADDPAADIAEAVKGRNISETTFLATDYLNHFNEIIMLVELIPDMPDCLEDAQAWQPKTYAEHFRDSGFSDAELAIRAYQHAPARYREPFDETVSHLNAVVAEGLLRVEQTLADGDTDRLTELVQQVCDQLRRLIDIANGIIHGFETTVDQSEIDQFFGSHPPEDTASSQHET